MKRGLVTLSATSALVCALFMQEQAQAQTVYGTTVGNNLVSFNATAPTVITASVSITGITAGQIIQGLDFRPNTGQLYAFGYNATLGVYQLYTINTSTGAATVINATATAIALGNGPIGFDFNPTVDRIRVTSANGGNYRLHPVTGAIAATDMSLAYLAGDANAGTTPKIVAGAYTNSYIGAGTTALFNYDNNLNIITLQSPPNNGSLNTIGASGISTDTVAPKVDMDIFYNNTTATNEAYLLANLSASNSVATLYTLATATGAATLVGNIGGTDQVTNIALFIDRTLPALTGQLAFGLSGTNLISFDTQNPNYIRTIYPITGVTAGQTIVGMDFRPANAMLYALGYNSTTNDAQLYTIVTTTGVATAVSATPMQLMLGATNVGFDFNPTVDRIRVVSNNDANYRLNPITAVIAATDSMLNFTAGDVNFGANPNAGSIAYTNSYSGATATTLYNYDEVLNVLTTQTPPNNGKLNTVGSTGIMVNSTDATVDMDIYYDGTTMTNTAYVAANINTETIDRLYTLNTTTGATTSVGKIGFGVSVRDISIQTAPIVTGINNEKNGTATFANVYPNPLVDNTTITLKNTGKVQVSVYNIIGKTIAMEATTETIGNVTHIHWNTANLENGLYFVSLTSDNGAKQIIKVTK
ncbi:MAG: DUF4394 domain-containing protein [Bacteroidia bacterium]